MAGVTCGFDGSDKCLSLRRDGRKARGAFVRSQRRRKLWLLAVSGLLARSSHRSAASTAEAVRGRILRKKRKRYGGVYERETREHHTAGINWYRSPTRLAMAGSCSSDCLPSALWLNLLPRARRAVARTRGRLQGRWSTAGRGWTRRSGLCPPLS